MDFSSTCLVHRNFLESFAVFVKVFPGDLKFSDLALTTCKLCRENKYDTNRVKTDIYVSLLLLTRRSIERLRLYDLMGMLSDEHPI